MVKARRTKPPSLPEWIGDQAKLAAEAKRVGLPSFALKLAAERDMRLARQDGKPVSRPD